MAAPVRGARILLTDDRGVRADMTASWLAQMGWETYVLEGGYDRALEVGPPDVLPKPDPSHRYRRPYEGTDVDTRSDAGLSRLGIRPGRAAAARCDAWVFCDLSFVGWAKARSAVPTIRSRIWNNNGGHGARAPLPTLRLRDLRCQL